MKINIIQTVTNILDENRQLINSMLTEVYVLYPAPGKAIKNKTNGKIYTSSVSIGNKGQIDDYIEVDF